MKSETLVKNVKNILRFQLSLQLCHGQCFDDASNMLRQRSRVAIQIYKEQPKAHYTDCHCHSLNSSIKDVRRSSKMLSNVMDTARGDYCSHQIFTTTQETFGKP